MSGKFMKIKKIVLPVMAAIILISQLSGCAVIESNEMIEMLNEGQDIELTMAMPDYAIDTIGEMNDYKDTRLDLLNTYTDMGFRDEFDSLFDIQRVDLENTTKTGCIYMDKEGNPNGNISFMDCIRNKIFIEEYFNTDEVQEKLSELGELAYIDVYHDEGSAMLAALNAYFNLLNDSTDLGDPYFNGVRTLTRGDFYSLVYRAINPVKDDLRVDNDFNTALGIRDSNAVYASQVDQYAWLSVDNGGLRRENYNSSITRAEAIYMLMNMYFSDEMETIDMDSIDLEDAIDGGSYLDDSIEDERESDALYTVEKGKQQLVKGWQLGALSKMLKSGGIGVQTDLYKALCMAYDMGIIDSETRFNEPICKGEAIQLLIDLGEALNINDGYEIK